MLRLDDYENVLRVSFCRWQHWILMASLAVCEDFSLLERQNQRRGEDISSGSSCLRYWWDSISLCICYEVALLSLTVIWNVWFKSFNFLFTEKRKKWMKAVVICTQCLIDSFKCEVRWYFQVLSGEVNHRPNIRFGIRFRDTFFFFTFRICQWDFKANLPNTEVTERLFCSVMFSTFFTS
jgi:hypothetical protein